MSLNSYKRVGLFLPGQESRLVGDHITLSRGYLWILCLFFLHTRFILSIILTRTKNTVFLKLVREWEGTVQNMRSKTLSQGPKGLVSWCS